MGNRLKVKWHLCSWYVNTPTLSTINSPKTCWTFGVEGEALVFGMIIMRFNLHMKASKCRRGSFIYFFFFFVIAVSISTGWCLAIVVHIILTSFMFNEYALIISLVTHFSYMCTYTLEKHQQMLFKPLKQALIFLILWFNTTAIKCILAKIVPLSTLNI